MSNKSNRADYWERGYFEYWKARVDEANLLSSRGKSAINTNDTRTPDDESTHQFLTFIEPKVSDVFLEVGCGFGRSVLRLAPMVKHVTAIDISSRMIEEAKKACEHINNVTFLQSEAEQVPADDQSFDKIFCYGVFEAVQQTDALCEFNRLLKLGGRCLITGKNTSFSPADEPAIYAEKMARENGHPNFFTDIDLLCQRLNDFGFKIVAERYFETRESMSRNEFRETRPEKFYYYGFVLEKVSDSNAEARNLMISSTYSSTWMNLNPGTTLVTQG